MKKIGKISINPEKVIKNEELVKLNGGYGEPCTCTCINLNTNTCIGYVYAETGDCNLECGTLYGFHVGGVCGNCPPWAS
jgi:natural product precursor